MNGIPGDTNRWIRAMYGNTQFAPHRGPLALSMLRIHRDQVK